MALGPIIYTHLSSDAIAACPFEAAVPSTLVSLQSYNEYNKKLYFAYTADMLVIVGCFNFLGKAGTVR